MFNPDEPSHPTPAELKSWTIPELVTALFAEKRGIDPCPANTERQVRMLATPCLLQIVIDDPECDEGAIAANIIIARAGNRTVNEYLKAVYGESVRRIDK
jgi:hypothetical protein